MNREKQIVPKVRFPEFEDDVWVKTDLGSIGKPLMCKRIFKQQTTTESENAIPFFKIGTFGREPDAYISVDLYNEFKKKYSFPNIGDILISASGTIGRLVVYDGSDAYYQDSNIVWLGHNETKIKNAFLYYNYTTLNWQTSDGGVIKRLYNSNLKEMEIFYPQNQKEQQKIASCLSSLDDVIKAEAEKLDLLVEHKKGLLQQIFPQEGETKPKYRFPEFQDDWVIKEVGAIFEVTRGYVLSMSLVSEIKTEKNKYPVYSSQTKNNGLAGYYSDFLYEDSITWTTDGANAGDVNFREGKFYCTNVCGVLLSKSGYANKCIAEIINSVAKKHVSYIGNPKLMNGVMSKIKIAIPSLKEQQKLAKVLSNVDELMDNQTQKIEDLQNHKKGLLQQLLPNINEVAV